MTTFNETAMAERFKAATESTDLASTMYDTYDLLMRLEPSNEREWEQIYGLRVMLKHITKWLDGQHDDKTVIDLVRLNIETTHKRLEEL
jgi:methyltransferase-like protein